MIKSFDEVFEDVTKLGVKIKTDEYHPIGKYQIIDQGQEAVAGYSDLEDGVFENVPAIVFGDHTRIVKYVDKPFFLGADGVKVLRSRFTDANYRYLYYALRNVKIPDTGYNRHFKWLKEAQICYPSAERQSQIVSILDGISSIIGCYEQQLQKLDELVKARFVELFGELDKNPYGWKLSSLGALIASCEAGWSGTGTQRKKRDGEVAVLKVSAVTKGYFIPSECKVLDNQSNIKKYIYPQTGDLLFSRANTREKVGATVVITEDFPEHILPDKLWKIRFVEAANVWYMKYALSSKPIRSIFSSISTGTSGSMYNVSMEKFKSIEIPLPPLNLQNQFAAFVSQTDKSKAVIQKALAEAQLLFDSLMQKYLG